MVYRFLLLPLFLFSFSITASDTTAPQEPDFLERVIQANQGEYQDPLGLSLEGTIKATASSTAYYTALYYGKYVFSPLLDPQFREANMRLANCYLKYGENVPDEMQAGLQADCDYLDGVYGAAKSRLKLTKRNNARYAKILAAQAATANLTYAAVRAATKELTGYDAALLVKDSVQAVAAQTVTNYLNPRVPLMNNNQIASYIATDLTVAASMYAYKEMTGKNLRCPELPIPMVLRNIGLDEQLVGGLIYSEAKYVLRTMVMDKLCGVPPAA